MSLLNSKFDVVTQENPLALASVSLTLAVNNPPALGLNGTPVAGTIAPGAIVTMNDKGEAVLGTSPDVTMADPVLAFVTIDGNMDYSGSFVQKITCLHGGVIIKTDQYNAGAYKPGLPVTFNGGKIALKTAGTQQVIGFVGPGGLDAVGGVLEVILTQGAGV